tara:strand:+ start:226 stop:630 length:405 start_codon:yes stop_codon:yes gene_type:complete
MEKRIKKIINLTTLNKPTFFIMTKSIKPKTLEPIKTMSLKCAKAYIEPEIRPIINQAKLIYKRLKSPSLNSGIGVSDKDKLIYWKLNRQFNLIEKSLYENWPYFCYEELRENFPNEFNPNTGIYWEREREQYEN